MTERAIGICLSCHKFLSHSASVSYFLFSLQLFEKVIVLLRQIDLHQSGFPTEEGGRGTFPPHPKNLENGPPPPTHITEKSYF